MALYEFRLPDVGEGTVEAEIAEWYVAVGDRVEEDQTLVDVMTDKATVDMTSPVAGVVLATHGELGERVAVGSVLVELEVQGADVVGARAGGSPALTAVDATPEAGLSAVEVTARDEPVEPPLVAPSAAQEIPLAAPATRRRAQELGIRLKAIEGTGPGGRITLEDLDQYVARGPEPTPAPDQFAEKTGVREIKLIGLRRKIAERMQEAKRRIPHFSYVEALDLTELELLRGKLNAERRAGNPKLTLLPFFMRAVAQLVPEFPYVNAQYDEHAETLRLHEVVHVGIATHTTGGLLVPVVCHVEALDLWGCAQELARLTSAAREGKIKSNELGGSTITLTSLGALGGVAATPIINPPEVAILGPNKLAEQPVVRDGEVVVRRMMNLSASFDHRIVDGHTAASFMQRIKGLMEEPKLIFPMAR